MCAHFVQSPSPYARPPAVPRDRATRNPRTIVRRRLATERDNFVTHSPRRRSGASRAVNVGSDVAITTKLERSTRAYSPGSQKSGDAALAGADVRKCACDRRRAAAGMRLTEDRKSVV